MRFKIILSSFNLEFSCHARGCRTVNGLLGHKHVTTAMLVKQMSSGARASQVILTENLLSPRSKSN